MKLVLVVFSLLLVAMFAMAAQQRATTIPGHFVVAVCGTLSPAYVAGTYQAATVDVNGKTCVNP